MTRSASTSEIKIPKSYAKMTKQQLQHKAGVAWAQGKNKLAEAIEKMAALLVFKRNPGQHGCVNKDKKPTAYPAETAHRLIIRGHFGGGIGD